MALQPLVPVQRSLSLAAAALLAAQESTPPLLSFRAQEARELQERFEVLPAEGARGWLGADSDVSMVIGGGRTGRRVLWIFADTFISNYDRNSEARVLNGASMPHSTVGLAECSPRECHGNPFFFWKTGAGDLPVSFFEPTGEQLREGLALWPVSGMASRDGASAVILCQRIRVTGPLLEDVFVEGTTAVSIEDVTVEDPRDWRYTVADVGDKNLTWFSGITYANPTDRADDSVFLFGHRGEQQNPLSDTVLARTSYAKALHQDWCGLQRWAGVGAAGGGWTTHGDPSSLTPLGVPTWESTFVYSEALRRWYSFSIEPFGTHILMHAAPSVTGPWQHTVVYDIPEPFSANPGAQWLCYAAKAHPELQSASELVLTYVCNTYDEVDPNQTMVENLFQRNGMSQTTRGYWPRFLAVRAA